MIISPASEIAIILGSSESAALALANETATQTLLDLLQIPTLERHTVTNEFADIIEDKIYLNDFPVDVATAITLRDSLRVILPGTYTYELPPRSLWTVRVLEGGYPRSLTYSGLYVTYTAGYTLTSKMTVLDIAAMDGKTFTVTKDGVSTTYTMKTTLTSPAVSTEIAIGANVGAAAANIAAKLSGSVSSAVVTLPLGSDAALGTLIASQVAIVNSDLPKNFRMAVAMLCGGMVAEQAKQGGIIEMQIDDKRVKFRDQADADTFQSIISPYLSRFERAGFSAI